MRVVLRIRFVDVIERALHHHLEPAFHFVFLPEVALQVLRPLEVANGHAARVGQDIRARGFLRCGLFVGMRRGRAVGTLRDDLRLDLSALCQT